MAGQLLPQVLIQQLNPNANPISGATFYFYLTETTTPTPVYADADLSTSLGVAVVADSSGRLPNIYLDPTITYRLIIKSAVGGTVIRDIDPLNANTFALTDLSNVDAEDARTTLGLGLIHQADALGILPGNSGATNLSLLNAAIATIGATGGGEIHFGPYLYNFAGSINLGNGTDTSYSTINGVRLRGTGLPFFRQGGGSPLLGNSTRFKYTGTAGGRLLRILGPCVSNDCTDIILDGNNLAVTCLQLVSASLGQFDRLAATNFTVTGVGVTSINALSISGSTNEMLTSVENRFGLLWINGVGYMNATVTCLDLDSLPGGAGVTRNHFEAVYTTIWRDGSTARRFGFADQNTFGSFVNSCFTPIVLPESASTTAATRLYGVPAFGGIFPQHQVDKGHYDSGQGCEDIIIEGTPGIPGGHDGGMGTRLDQQLPMNLGAAKVYRRVYHAQGYYPRGGFRTESGLLITDRAFRNPILNGFFEITTGGKTFVNPVSAAALTDTHCLRYDGTATVTVSILDIDPGETELPRSNRVRRFMRLAFTGGTSTTFRYMALQIPDARTFRGCGSVLSCWARVTAGSASLTKGRIERNFGTGGSPSTTDGTEDATAFALTSAWSWPRWRVDLPDDAGKTYGTADDGYINVFIGLPLTGTFTVDIAMPQWEVGYDATLAEYRHPKLEAVLCA